MRRDYLTPYAPLSVIQTIDDNLLSSSGQSVSREMVVLRRYFVFKVIFK